MNETKRVSALMLERYHLGEVSAEEKKFVEDALTADKGIRSRYESLDASDRELRRLYPWEQSPLKNLNEGSNAGLKEKASHERGRFHRRKYLWGLCAAAVFVCILFPSVYYLRGQSGAEASKVISGPDRIKGTEIKQELSIYLKETAAARPADEGHRLQDRALLKEGNTVQLAYTIPPGNSYYGVIFSIDGRSELTMHYPYQKGQSPVLTAGKQTFLDEAYTLDDAPFFEIFFLVVSQKPLNTEDVLKTAWELAKEPKTALEKSTAAFGGCEVEAITIRK